MKANLAAITISTIIICTGSEIAKTFFRGATGV
jgi:hypothetical protein